MHCFAPLVATMMEMYVPNIQYQHWLEMARLFICVQNMKNKQLPKTNLRWHKRREGLVERPGKFYANMTWLHWGQNLLRSPGLNRWRMLHRSTNWRTYNSIKDYDHPTWLVRANLLCDQRSLVPKLLCAMLPIELAWRGRYQGILVDERHYRVCGTGAAEDEIHILFYCPTLTDARKSLLNLDTEMGLLISDME